MTTVKFKSNSIMGLSVVPGDIIDVNLLVKDEDSGTALLVSTGNGNGECSSVFFGKFSEKDDCYVTTDDTYTNISNRKARKLIAAC